MKLSTKGRYAMRAMLDLAQHYSEGLVLVKDVAKRQEISERYLEHLFISLKTAGLVKSVRGAHGGFTLARQPSEIKLLEVVQVCEGPLTLMECVMDAGLCPRSSRCATRDVWRELQSAMDGVLGSMTLQDLIERQQAKEQHLESGD
ncbi:MAG: RrF2 family transcriptional regulator [Dehalococcoidales bacterium]|nr:RrF2 family transcriptional regulator [Dehalococcoidales bacterium]